MPSNVLASVDLPEPDSPTSPSVSPSLKPRSMLTNAGTSEPRWRNVFDTPVSFTIVSVPIEKSVFSCDGGAIWSTESA